MRQLESSFANKVYPECVKNAFRLWPWLDGLFTRTVSFRSILNVNFCKSVPGGMTKRDFYLYNDMVAYIGNSCYMIILVHQYTIIELLWTVELCGRIQSCNFIFSKNIFIIQQNPCIVTIQKDGLFDTILLNVSQYRNFVDLKNLDKYFRWC